MPIGQKRPGPTPPRATFRVYGQESIDALNEICDATGQRPSELVAGWIALHHAELLDNGKITPKGNKR